MLILFNVKVKCKSTHDWVLMIRITPGQGRTFWYLDTFKPEHVVISCLVYTNASVYWLRLSAHSWRHLCSNIILDRFTRTFYGFMNTLCLIILTERSTVLLQLYLSQKQIYCWWYACHALMFTRNLTLQQGLFHKHSVHTILP